MQAKVFGPLGMTRTTFDYAKARGDGGRRVPARERRGREDGARPGHVQRQRRARAARGRRVDDGARSRPVRRDGAREGDAPGRQAPRLRGEPPRAPRAAGPARRGRLVRHGSHDEQALRHHARPPRRRRRGVPQRHVLAARVRRRRRDLRELRRRRRPARAVRAEAPRAPLRRQGRSGARDARRRREPEGGHREGARASRRSGRPRARREARVAVRVGGARRRSPSGSPGAATVFDVGEWKSAVASRKNDDGTVSFLTIDPTLAGFEFVVADKDGRRRLVVRDAQHEYVFEEAAAPGAKAP